MSDNKDIETEAPLASRSEELAETPQAAPTTPKKLPWTTRHRNDIIGVTIGAALIAAVAAFMASVEGHVDETMDAANMESAYTAVALQQVPVNGYRGSPEWRGYYKVGLERFLGQHDFSDLCTPNGFLKDSFVYGVLPCIAVGDKRAVRAFDDTISYFKEDSWRRMTHPLDIMDQDIHSDGYLDIDAFSKAVEDRASKQVADAAAAAKAADDAVAQNTRIFKEALQLVVPLDPDHVTRLPDAK
jgi:hypothetical protein